MRAGAAVLTGVVEDAVRRRRCGLLDVGVGEHDVRALAAELERHPLHLLGGARHDARAHLGGTREADLADEGMSDEALAHD